MSGHPFLVVLLLAGSVSAATLSSLVTFSGPYTGVNCSVPEASATFTPIQDSVSLFYLIDNLRYGDAIERHWINLSNGGVWIGYDVYDGPPGSACSFTHGLAIADYPDGDWRVEVWLNSAKLGETRFTISSRARWLDTPPATFSNGERINVAWSVLGAHNATFSHVHVDTDPTTVATLSRHSATANEQGATDGGYGLAFRPSDYVGTLAVGTKVYMSIHVSNMDNDVNYYSPITQSIITTATPPNLLSNAGFESSFDGWSTPAWGTQPAPLLSRDNPHTGSTSACLGIPSDSSSFPSRSAISQTITLPDTPSTLSFWYRAWTRGTAADLRSLSQYQAVRLFDAQGTELATLMLVLDNDNVWKKRRISLAGYRGQTVTAVFDVFQDGASPPTGMCIDDVSINKIEKTTVFVIHGIAQGADGVTSLGLKLRATLDPDLYVIDARFDYGECANYQSTFLEPLCPSTCTIPAGGEKLASYIRDTTSDIIFVGYSMGGLVARDLIVNNYGQVLDNRTVSALITLGTPNLGYPYDTIDDYFRCAPLVRQMFGDLRNASQDSPFCNVLLDRIDCKDWKDETHSIALSSYLFDLNTRWTSLSALHLPSTWMAASGRACSTPTRGIEGCSDKNPFNDGVVCDQSARFDWPAANGPSDRSFASPDYSHTKTLFTWPIFTCSTDSTFHDYLTPLYDPNQDLILKIKSFIDGRP